jgi:hypothetical protein
MRKATAFLVLLAFALAVSLGGLIAQDTTKTSDTTKAVEPQEPAVIDKAVPDTGDTMIAEEKEEAEESKFDYVGPKKCKICHKDQYDSWLLTGHARAWDLLKPEEQKKEECIGCHSTGTTAKGEFLEGVQCEACHGPGSEYRKTKIMKDKELALESGMVEPTAEVCVKCHNEESPTFKGFDYDTYIQNTEAIHAHTEKEKEE